MSQSEYQIPNGEHSNPAEQGFVEYAAKVENITNFENVTPQASIRSNVYNIYDQIDKNKGSNNSELDNQIIKKLYYIADDLAELRKQHLNSPMAMKAAERSRVAHTLIRILFDRDLSPKYKNLLTERELKIEEGEIGADIFGPLDSNERRAFFNDNHYSWFFYQEKVDSSKTKHSTTLHYEVRPEGVLRINNKVGMQCELITGQELDNFVKATEIYHSRVTSQIYSNSIRHDGQLAA